MIANFVGIGFIGIGIKIGLNSIAKYSELNKKISNEKIYVMPKDKHILTNTRYDNSNDVILQIPSNFIDGQNTIGQIKLNKICNEIKITYKYDVFGDIIKIRKNNTIKKPCLEKVLFPVKMFKKLGIECELEIDKQTKILFDNSIESKPNSFKNLYEKFLSIAHEANTNESNTYKFTSVNRYNDRDFELIENYIGRTDDVYLIVNPLYDISCENNDVFIKKLNIKAIGNNEKKVILKKYENYANDIDLGFSASLAFVLTGIGILFIK